MIRSSNSCHLTIFEGPDGAGKTTAAFEYAKETGAAYVHFPSLPNVKLGLARLYVEAMLPALLGYQNVVFDRCWLSEHPYGQAFRGGADRLGLTTRLLERLAFRCGAVVVKCLPPWEVVLASYQKRKGQEMLENEDQLRHVYDIYAAQETQLPSVFFDYTEGKTFAHDVYDARPVCHPIDLASAGHWDYYAHDPQFVLVGEKFAERKNTDPWYQWPFASFCGSGCSQWITRGLEDHGIGEAEILWANADQDLSLIDVKAKWIALGGEAATRLISLGIPHETVPHPQYWKRFYPNQPYSLFTLMGGVKK